MSSTSVVVGVTAAQVDALVGVAAAIATAFDATLVCVVADGRRVPVHGGLRSVPIDPDADDPGEPVFPEALRERIAAILAAGPVPWVTRALPGEAAEVLMQVADEAQASLIVVGTRRPGPLEAMREFVDGSVAARLAHRQFRPVIVVPITPAPRTAAGARKE